MATEWKEKVQELTESFKDFVNRLAVSKTAQLDEIASALDELETELCEWFDDDNGPGDDAVWASERLRELDGELCAALDQIEELEEQLKPKE